MAKSIKLFGHSVDVMTASVCLIVGVLLGGHILCESSATSRVAENFMADRHIAYTRDGIPRFHTPCNLDDVSSGRPSQWFSGLARNTQGLKPPLKDGQMDIFAKNRIAPDCCPSIYSSSDGCVCITEDQMRYLNQRGGNRTQPTEY